jgi:glycosyltransferase involved in cell wall biosynthesis
MIHVFLNGLAASAGGGLTYLRNVVPHLAARDDVHTSLAVSRCIRQEFGAYKRVSVVDTDIGGSAAGRFFKEQRCLPQLIRQAGADVLISAGNFALRKSPVPQILLSRNSLYTSADYYRDLRARREYGLCLDTRFKGFLAKRSIHWAERTVAPSEAFAEELRGWTRRPILSIHHGFDRDAFFDHPEPLPRDVQQKLDGAVGDLKLLLVSHYNYYRNFETLFQAMPDLCHRLNGKVKLVLTCSLRSEANPGAYLAESAAALVQRLGISQNVLELGTVPYHLLHHVYRACAIYVAPAYAESFAHPLVEAMASGLPVIASDLDVHREICGSAALYFSRFSSQELADQVFELAQFPEKRGQLSELGGLRADDFGWNRHVAAILELARSLIQ